MACQVEKSSYEKLQRKCMELRKGEKPPPYCSEAGLDFETFKKRYCSKQRACSSENFGLLKTKCDRMKKQGKLHGNTKCTGEGVTKKKLAKKICSFVVLEEEGTSGTSPSRTETSGTSPSRTETSESSSTSETINFGHGVVVRTGNVVFPEDKLEFSNSKSYYRGNYGIQPNFYNQHSQSSVQDFSIKAEIVEKAWSSIRPVEDGCTITHNCLKSRSPIDHTNDPVLCLSLFLPNDLLEKKEFHNVYWQAKYLIPQIKLILVFRYLVKGDVRIYLDQYLIDALKKAPPKDFSLSSILEKDATHFEYPSFMYENSVKEFLNSYLKRIKSQESSGTIKTLFDKLLMYYETASSFDGTRFGDIHIDVFGYKFSEAFIENKGTPKEGHIKNGYLGQQARYMILQQNDYVYNGRLIHRPRHIVWRDAHNNCCTSLDADMILSLNAEGIKTKSRIYLLPSSRYYEPAWNDRALCRGNGMYKRRSAVAGWVQMCNFTSSNVFLDTKNFVLSAGLPFLLNKKMKPVLDLKRMGKDDEVVDGFEYGIDEYANTQFFNLPHFVQNSIYLFHCYHSDITTIDFFSEHDPAMKAYIMVTYYILKEKVKNSRMKRIKMISEMENLRNTPLEKLPFELRSCLRVLMSMIPNKYQMMATVFSNEKTHKLNEEKDYGSELAKFMKKYPEPRLLQSITFENLKKLGITCNTSIMMNSADWCEEPYFNQKMERSDCPPSLYLSGLYKDALPETMVTQVRQPSDIPLAVQKCKQNKNYLKLKLSDYKLDEKTVVPKNLQKYEATQGVISQAHLKELRSLFTANTLKIIKKVADNIGAKSSEVLTKFVWRVLMLNKVDIPRVWFQIDSIYPYPPDTIFRPMIEEANKYATVSKSIISILS